MRNYYTILGIRPDATRDEIKDAWNFSVKAFHPDKFTGSSPRQQALAQERTKSINEAYEVLFNPIKRTNYDWQYTREHSAGAAAPPPSPPPPPPTTARGPSCGNCAGWCRREEKVAWLRRHHARAYRSWRSLAKRQSQRD